MHQRPQQCNAHTRAMPGQAAVQSDRTADSAGFLLAPGQHENDSRLATQEHCRSVARATVPQQTANACGVTGCRADLLP